MGSTRPSSVNGDSRTRASRSADVVDRASPSSKDSDQQPLLAAWDWRPSTGEVFLFEQVPERGSLRETCTDVDGLLACLPHAERDPTLGELVALQKGDHGELVRRYKDNGAGQADTCVTVARAVRDGRGRLLMVRATVTTAAGDNLAVQQHDRAPASLQAALDALPLSIALVGRAGQVLMTNRNWEASLGADCAIAAGCGSNYIDALQGALDSETAESVVTELRRVLTGAEPRLSTEFECDTPSGRRTHSLVAEFCDGDGESCAAVSSHDLTQSLRDQSKVKLRARLVDAVDVAVVATGRDGCVTYWNPAAVRLYGWTAAEAHARRLADLIGPSSVDVGTPEASDLLLPEAHFTAARKDGTSFPAYVRRASVSDATGRPELAIDATFDVSDRVAERRKLLGARNYLRAVTDSMGEGLFTLDIDGRLTYMNRAAEVLLGWSRHDLLGRRMHEITHTHRADGSELPSDECEILAAARDGETRRIDDDVFVDRAGRQIPVAYTASALYDEDAVEGCVVVFEDISERKLRDQRRRDDAHTSEVVARIKTALLNEMFVLYAQPIIDLASGKTIQQELLLRMREPSGEIVGPPRFLAIAEQEGLIGDIDRWVIMEAVRMAAHGSRVELNISASSIGQRSMLEHLKTVLAREQADPELLIFEMTETAIIADEINAVAFAEGLHELGCRLALDDFGTGYGSFTYLKRLPVDFLKIDIEFVRDVVTSASSRHVIEAVVALARSFGLRTVAEGIEDLATFELLPLLGVDFGQGFYLGRPAPIPDACRPPTLAAA